MRSKVSRGVLWIALIALAFEHRAAAADFDGAFTVTRRYSSAALGKDGPVMVTLRTEVEVSGADGTISAEEFASDAARRHASGRRHLTARELTELRAALREAALFSGECAGIDSLGFDGWFETLEIRDWNGHYVLHAVSGNASFRSGSRKRLMDYLQTLSKSTMENDPAPRAPTAQPRSK